METKRLDGLNILLVEEEALIAMDIEQLCLEHGAAAVTAVNSLGEADGDLDISNVSAAILDVKIGERSTIGLAHELLKHRIPFVFATGYAETEPFFSDFPNVVVVPKPYAGEELMEALAASVSRARQPLCDS